MEIAPATEEQIAVFKKAAAAEYAKHKVPPAVADQLFNAYMAKLAVDLGIAAPPLTKRADAVATEIAKALGRTRK
jgi:hypothetical protein